MKRPFKFGQVFEDCGLHPVWTTECFPIFRSYRHVHPELSYWYQWLKLSLLGTAYDWDLAGVSLLDGSRPRSCSAQHCAPRLLEIEEVAAVLANREKSLIELRRIRLFENSDKEDT